MPSPDAEGEEGRWDASTNIDDPNGTWWIAAPTITVQLYTNASWLSTNSGKIKVYKWNGPGTTSFNHVYTGETNGGLGARDNTWRFVHNCSEDYDEHDDSNIHLWKFVVETSGGGEKTLSLRAGSIKSSVHNNPNTGKAGRLIRGCCPDYWMSGNTYKSDKEFVQGEAPQYRRGTQIDEDNANFCYGEF